MGADRAMKQLRQQPEAEPEPRPLAELAESTRRGEVNELSDHDVISRSPTAAAALVDAASGGARDGRLGTRVQPKLVVGAADDSYEHEADAMADAVMNNIAPGSSSFSPPPMGRVARQAEVGAEGGAISSELERSIDASSGSALPDAVRTKMESQFGADLSAVRVHTDSPSASKIQARAFTQGSDIHFAPGQFQPDTPGGQHLIAHELAHVVQQTAGVNRLMWEQADFDKQTSETFTTKSTAQKEIRAMLVGYNEKYPYGPLDEAKATQAFDVVTRMKLVADAYLRKNIANLGTPEEIQRGSRKNRIAGMQAFAATCESELSRLKYQLDRDKADADKFDDAAATQRVQQEDGITKITEHYDGDAVSCFRKLGNLIEAAAPMDGDKAGISLQVKIPVAPGAFVSLGFGASVERGDAEQKYVMPKDQASGGPAPTPSKVSPVSVALNVSAGGGGNAGPLAELAGALGVYIQSRAQTGADAAELLSYALFRRGRSSSAIPREVVNFMWGQGNSDAFGWEVAEQWSLGVEKRLLDSLGDDGSGGDKNENFVETGGSGKFSGEVGVSSKVAKVEFAAEAYQGTRIDATSLKARKGGAGESNKTSGKTTGLLAKGGKDMTKQGDRGTTQKDVGRTTHGFKLSGSAGNDMLKGGLEFGMRWISDGAHGKKTYSLSEASLGGTFGVTMPADQFVSGGIGNMIPVLVEQINRMVGTAKSRVAAEENATPRTIGNVGSQLDTGATSIAMLAKSKEAFTPPTKLAEESAGFGSSTTYTLSLAFDFVKNVFTITISQDKSSTATKVFDAMTETVGGATGIKLEMTKSSRLLQLTLEGGQWSGKWAGGEF